MINDDVAGVEGRLRGPGGQYLDTLYKGGAHTDTQEFLVYLDSEFCFL